VRRCRMVVCGAIAARAVGRGTQCGGKMTLTKPRPTFKVDFSEKKDDPLDFAFRHCRIMERDGARFVRTFTGNVPRSQSTRKRVRQDICSLV